VNYSAELVAVQHGWVNCPSVNKHGDHLNEKNLDRGEKEQRAVQSIEVGGRLLIALANNLEPMSLKDLAAKADLTPSRAHPYLVSFSKLGLIEQVSASGRYGLGPLALQVGLTCLHQLDPIKVATPIAEELAASTGHAVALAVWGNFGPTIIRMIEARQPLLVSMRAGTVMSILSTATGQAFAAVIPTSRIMEAMANALGDPADRETPIWRDSGKALQAVVDGVRQHGLARAEGSPILSVNAFSGVALNHEGEAAIGITILGHRDNFPVAWDAPLARRLKTVVAEISSRLGWQGAIPSVK
jgi:DNA-binding IclR family transcriptional regulator